MSDNIAGAGENLASVEGMEPAAIWREFARIAAIPRCSEKEERIRAYIESFAEDRGFEYESDSVGNIVVRKPAHERMREAPPIVLQGHLDMVCEKNQGVGHDFTSDPIRLVRDGEWLRAKNTTLGADNGIAVAMILALLDDRSAVHGPLEALFTVNEEGGLVGATKLDGSLVRGRRLINLDSEEEGIFIIGCAGGQNTEGSVPVQREPAGSGVASGIAVRLSVTGLRGGHSGSDIHEGRGNAIVLAVRFLWHAAREMRLLLTSLDGGGLHNAIPRECFAGFVVGVDDYEGLETMARDYEHAVAEELGDLEPGLSIRVERSSALPENHVDGESTSRLLDTLYALPHGVVAMSRRIPGLVDTSTNLAAVHLEAHEARILTSQRSTFASARDDVADRIRAVVEHGGGRVAFSGVYPSWPPEKDSSLIRLCRDTYARRTGGSPVVTAIHAGLECGVLGEKLEGAQMISFGPAIEGAHTPEERVDIASTGRVWELLLEVLAGLSS